MTFDGYKTCMERVEKETECKKPPLGAPPYWIAIDARIREVGGAISRYDSSTQSIKDVKAWAEEILVYCKTVETIEDIQNKYKKNYVPF